MPKIQGCSTQEPQESDLAPSSWEDLAQDCTQWRNTIGKGVDVAKKGLKEATE